MLSLNKPVLAFSLERAASVNTSIFFYFRGCCLDDFLMHSLLKPAIIASQSQKDPWGLWRPPVHAGHKQGHDSHLWPLQLIYTAAIQKHQLPHACCVRHSTEPWPERDVRTPVHNPGSYTPRSFAGDQMTLSVMIVEEPQFDPRIIPSDGTMPGFPTSGATLLGRGRGFLTFF